MILPMVALSLAYIASIARITRGSMIEVLHSNFIRTARERVTYAADHFTPRIKTCSVTRALLYGPRICRHYYRFYGYRTIYGFAGIGQLFVNGALNRDYSLVLSLTITVGALTILFNAIVDVLYAVIDPKIRY